MRNKMKYITSQKMREIDKLTQEEFGIPAIILMENAGRMASQVAFDMLLKSKKGKVICICGRGNNGSDGFVSARHLFNNGVDIEVFLVGELFQFKGDAKINFDILRKIKVRIRILKTDNDLKLFKEKLKGAELIIDAIFGIGLSGEVKEPYRSIIKVMNKSKKPILAIDVPSGLDATEGKILGVCVKAAKTVTFALPKIGFIRNDGPFYIGELVTVDISIPKELLLENG